MLKLLQALAIVLLTLVVLEAALQLGGALGVSNRAGELGVGTSSGAIVILCVGDSHTFGASVRREGSYPSHLQRLLHTRYPAHEFRAVNLGMPGVNTAYVANRLERQILEIRPQLVIVWAGINNSWNAVETEAWGTVDAGTALRRLLLSSKLFRLASVVWYTRSTRYTYKDRGTGYFFEPLDEAPITQDRGERLAGERLEFGIAFDIERMVETARALQLPILLVDYPYPYEPIVVRAIQNTGERLGVPVIRTLDQQRRAIAEGHSIPELVRAGAGPHPTSLLYRYIAESMVPQVAHLLRDVRGIDLDALPLGREPLLAN